MVTVSVTGDPQQIAEVIVAIKRIENATPSKPEPAQRPHLSVVASAERRTGGQQR